MDLGAVAHLAAIKSRVPFLNFFDGFRTSHEIQKIEVWDYEDLKEMCDMDAVEAFRKRALNPEHPTMRGMPMKTAISSSSIVKLATSTTMQFQLLLKNTWAKLTLRLGTNYQLFNYYGAPDAERVIVAMGSICDVAEEVIDYLTAKGEKVGLVKVRLFRPFSAETSARSYPRNRYQRSLFWTVPKSQVLMAEPLHLDVMCCYERSRTSGYHHRRSLRSGLQGHNSSKHLCSLRRAVRKKLQKQDLLSASTMTLLICPWKKKKLQTPLQKAPSNASSGVWAATVLLAQTRTPSRSSVTIPINMYRHTSSMTPRRPAVSPFPICVLVTNRSRAHTTSTRQTLLLATTHPM